MFWWEGGIKHGYLKQLNIKSNDRISNKYIIRNSSNENWDV